MKKFILAATLAVASLTTFAQDDAESKSLNFSLGLELGMPIGDYDDFYGFGVGATAQADYSLSENFALTLNAGYITFSAKDFTFLGVTTKGDALGVIPVLAGFRYNFSPNIYGSGQLGMSFLSGGGDGSAFTYAPGVGFRFSKFDVLVKYTGLSVEGGSSFNNIGLRAAYTF